MTEAQLHRSVAQYLSAVLMPGVFWCHVPNGGNRDAITGAILKSMGAKAGVPDILIIHEGRAFWIELKAENGRTSKAQRAVLGELVAAGCEAWLARSIGDVAGALVYWGIPTRLAKGAA